MGIVTWAVLKGAVLPALRRMFFVPARRIEDLVNFTYRILRVRFGDEIMVLNNAYLAGILGKNPDEIKALMGKIPPFIVLIGISGRDILPRERVEYQQKDIREMAQMDGLQLVPAVPGAGESETMEAVLNPSREPYWKLGYKGGCQDIFFVTTLNKTPDFIKKMYATAEALGYSSADIGVYIQPVHQGSSCHLEFSLPYDPNNKQDTARMKDLFNRASAELQQEGAFFSRPYGAWAEMAFNRDARSTEVIKKLKNIFDPNNVMNPGKLCF
jgi:FAD/FMN-containing dehydrogenase